MNKDKIYDALRRRAEASLSGRPGEDAAAPGEADTLKLLHELQVQQVELELQNAELRQTRADLEAALERYVDFYDLSPVAFLTLESDGRIREVNLTGSRLLGIERSGLIGRRLGTFVSPDYRAGFNACLAKVFEEQGTAVFELYLEPVSGYARHLRMDLVAVPAGRLCRVVAVDDSGQKQSELALWRERRFLRQVIDACPSLIFVKDRRGRFLLGNAALAACYGTGVDGLLGRTDADFNADAEEVARFRRDDLQVIDSRAGKLIDEERVTYADGSEHFMTTSKVPLEDEHGGCDRVLGVATDITARRQAEAALKDADRLKNEFLAMLGHELRNPLVPIRNAAHVIGRLESNEPTLKWAQGLIERQVSHLGRLLDDLLDLSRILGGRIELKRTRVELAGIVAQALETARPMIEDKRQSLAVSLPDQPVWIEGDAMRLTQVLVNLLRNATKYTDAGGHIELTARMPGTSGSAGVELCVRDDGVGITPELLPRIFDLFTQDQRSLDRAQGGLGIGLALVRKVVELHGGRVTASSAGPGSGSEFTIRLPVVDRPDPVEPGPAAAPASAKLLRVLVVDDDPSVLESTAVVLQLDGHEVFTAAGGDSALELVRAVRPHLVLLDIGLGGMDGYQVARRMRALPDGDRLMLVAMSGYGQEDDRKRSAAAGFDRHLVKPVAPEVLASLLEQVAVSGRGL